MEKGPGPRKSVPGSAHATLCHCWTPSTTGCMDCTNPWEVPWLPLLGRKEGDSGKVHVSESRGVAFRVMASADISMVMCSQPQATHNIQSFFVFNRKEFRFKFLLLFLKVTHACLGKSRKGEEKFPWIPPSQSPPP